MKTDEQFKDLTAKFNLLRDRYSNKELSRTEIKNILCSFGFGKDNYILPIMNRYNIVIKVGETRNVIYMFPKDPVHWTKIKQCYLDLHKIWRDVKKRNKKTDTKTLSLESALDLLQNLGYIIEDGNNVELTEQSAIALVKLSGKVIKKKVISYEVV